MNRWWGYVTTIAQVDNQSEIAVRVGIDQTTVSRWKRFGAGSRVASVGRFARAYDRPFVEACVAAGYLSEQEAQAHDPDPIATIPTAELARELARRLA